MRGIIRIFLIVAISALSLQELTAQFFSLGNDPGKATWRIIKSENYSLIYPREIDSLARTYLYEMERSRDKVNEPLRINPKPIPVILHPYTTVSNGSVAWAPKRVDLITSPAPYDGSADYWQRHLVTHELRHVGQIEHYTKGVYNVLYYLLGEQSTGIGLGLLVSKSTMEGDAVISETELSKSGRGRSADFNKHIRAMYLSSDFRNWDRIYLGSYKYFTPDMYVFGYHLESYIRYQTERYSIISQYFSIPVKYWYRPKRFLYPIEYATGYKRSNFFKESQHELRKIWMEELSTKGELTQPQNLLNKNDRLYTNLESPVYIECPESKYHRQIIAIKEGFHHATSLIRVDSTGKEHFIRYFNPISSRLVYNGYDKIYWTEHISKSAAILEDYSIVKYLDLKNGKVDHLSTGTKYFNPAISPDNKTIAVSEYTIEGKTYLTYIDALTGDPISRISAPANGQIKENTYFGEKLYSTIITEEGMAIYRQCDTGWKRISKLQHQSISNLRSTHEYIYFTSDLDGVLNIYTYYPDKDSLVRITNSKFGADFPFISEQTLYYSDYTLNGYKLGKNQLTQLTGIEKDFEQPYKYPLAEFLTRQHQDSTTTHYNDTINTFDTEKYPSKYYSKTLHSFRIHSWYPIYIDMTQLQNFSLERIFKVASPGITLLSQNSLGSISSQISYAYMNRRHTGHFSINAKILGNLTAELKLSLNQREQYYYYIDYSQGALIQYHDHTTPQFTSSLTIYYPLNFNSGGWYRVLNPQVNLSYNNDAFYSHQHKEYRFKYELRYGISYGQVLPTAHAEIFPRWGFGVQLFGASAPGTGENFGNLAFGYAYGYFPGIIRGQGLKLSVMGQHQFVDNKMYYLGSYASLPRGYNSQISTTETYWKVSADYAIPIYLGDVSLGPILYLKRMQLIPFGDFAIDYNPRTTTTYYSYGADILVDFNLLRFTYPMSMGVRYARTGPQTGTRNSFSFLFNISF